MNKADEWIAVAVLGRPRGVRGEITAISLSSKPGRFARLKKVRLLGEAGLPSFLEVERVWEHDGAPIFKFEGVDSMDDVEPFRGAEVQIHRSERVELEPGEFFHSDLIGCEVRERPSGRAIGVVTEFEEYGGPALLSLDHGRVLIPFVKAICVDIRPADRLIEVELPEGLLELDKLKEPEKTPPKKPHTAPE